MRLDPTVLEEMLRLIDSGIDVDQMEEPPGNDFLAHVKRIGRHVGKDRLAVAVDEQGRYCYFTFAGRLLNNVVAKWAELDVFHAGEIMLRADRPLDLSRLPIKPEALGGAATLALQVPGELSVFQGLLPTDMLERELCDVWLKTMVYRRSLVRLRESEQVSAPIAALMELCD